MRKEIEHLIKVNALIKKRKLMICLSSTFPILIELYNDNVIKAVNKNGKSPRKNTFSENNTIFFPE